ncbi:hypothetical protein WR25_18623 [Diploscapter pachys]|uniref:Uncharacterized protein n=1 Tax=Diploscapter pachys TaxID=2018661 RepID=A0A2A2LN67_9BILA|nr:hypothetical protein WR25_18623 [Diploscapter pachys]
MTCAAASESVDDEGRQQAAPISELEKLHPICCTSSEVRVDGSSCINDQLNTGASKFHHSVTTDLTYRGFKCWHQYNSEQKLVDFLWKVEICPLNSPIVEANNCDPCDCACGISHCPNGIAPIKVMHRQPSESCACDCTCTFKCLINTPTVRLLF